jgi:Tetratricopeptide repeat
LRETKPVRILGTIVKPDSADPGLHLVRAWAMDHDHFSIAKPRDRSDEIYAHVKQFVIDPFERPKPRIERLAEEISEGQKEEAVSIRRNPARAQPAAFSPNLATSLNNLAAILHALGRHQEAAAAAQEATELRGKK